MKSKIGILMVSLLACSMVIAQDNEIELTVYNSNLGFVREKRTLELPKGLGEIQFKDVASLIDATSVHFKSLDNKDVLVLDQNYEYDLVNSDKLLSKHIDKGIKVLTKDKGDYYEGTLLSFDYGQLVIKTSKGIAMINRVNVQDIQFEALPEGLITRPTLMWYIDGKNGGKQKCEISYLTAGINWRCDYTVVVSDDDKQFKDLAGWVTINNSSGATYKDTKLKLIAGDVHRVEPPRSMPHKDRRAGGRVIDEINAQAGFAEKAFFEYHLYTLGRVVTIKENQIKQEELINTHNIPVTKIYEFDAGQSGPYYGYDYGHKNRQEAKVAVKLEFKNSKENNMGMPLPKGLVRVYKEDKDTKSLEFIGEDNIDHTPKDEKRKITIGNAFDIVGERKQTDFKQISDRVHKSSYEIKLKNHKDVDIEVVVVEHLYGDWEITKESHEHTKKDAFTAEWKLAVPKNGETILTYTVTNRW